MYPLRFSRSSALFCLALLLPLGYPAERVAAQSERPGKARGFPVSTVAIDGLIQKPANLFDLEGKTLRFTPQSNGSYKVETLTEANLVDADTPLAPPAVAQAYGLHAWRVDLPFPFSFGGKNWDALHVNNNGSLSFDKPESEHWPQRDPWPDAGMRSVAAAIDSRSVAGQERTIAVLWAPNDMATTRAFTKSEKDRLVVTWQAKRLSWAHAVAGENLFQVRLHRSGVIEMVYQRVPER